MTNITKKDIRLINKAYQHSKRFMLRWPLSDFDIDRFEYNIEDIDNSINKGYLRVETLKTFPDMDIDVLRVHPDYEQYITEKTKYFLSQKREEMDTHKKKEQRAGYIDHYKYERNPHMGWKLTNEGGKFICTECMVVNKPCEHGKEFIKKLPPEARVPRANASKTRWRAFKNLFLNN